MITKNNFFSFLFGAILACVVIFLILVCYSAHSNDKVHVNDHSDHVLDKEIMRKELGVGSVGSDVVEVQERLREIGVYGNEEILKKEVGFYGEQTQFYVTLFQVSQNITPTGVVDQKTWDTLTSPVVTTSDQLTILQQGISIGSGFGIDDIYYSPTFQKTAYLTFNVGEKPEYIDQIITLLEKYGASATFFVPKKQLEQYKAIQAITQRNGIDVVFGVVQENTRKELSDVATVCFRPTYNVFLPDVAQEVKTAYPHVIMWNVDPQDWRGTGVDMIVQHVRSYTQNEDIILLHDTEQTVLALKKILDHMSSDKWVFRVLQCS